MFVVLRYQLESAQLADFLAEARAAVEALSQRPGFVRAQVGQAIDQTGLVALTLEFVDIGSYRRALGGYDVKLAAVPLLSRAVYEPTA